MGLSKKDAALRQEARQLAEAQHERDMSLRMMKDPGSWPSWPRLPLKNRKERDPRHEVFPLIGTMFEQEKVIVYLGTMFEDLRNVPTREYATLEEAIDAGWVVD